MIQPTDLTGPRLKAIWRECRKRRAAGESKASIQTYLQLGTHSLTSGEVTLILSHIDA